MEHGDIIFHNNGGMSSFQLTIRHIFQRGWLKPPTSYVMFALLLHIQLHIRHSNPYGYGSK